MAAKSKIAFLLPDLTGGGAERVAVHLAQGIHARGHAVDVIVLRGGGVLESLLPEGIRLIDLQAPRLRVALRPLIGYLRRERPDGLLAFMWPLTLIAVLARRLAGGATRLVLSDHCALSEQYSRAINRLIGVSVRLLYPCANARVLVSEGAAADLASLSGLDRSAFEVVFNPVPAPPHPSASAVALARGDWPATGKRILNVGSLKGQKNQALLLRAFALLGRDTDAQLVILGEGAERDALQHLAADLGIADRVALPGFRIDPSPYFHAADLFVLSSDYEGFGLVLVEALHAGLPIVSTDCPSGPAEVLDDGLFGRLVPVRDAVALADAMRETLASPPEADSQRRRAAHFDPDEVVSAYLDRLLGSSPS